MLSLPAPTRPSLGTEHDPAVVLSFQPREERTAPSSFAQASMTIKKGERRSREVGVSVVCSYATHELRSEFGRYDDLM